MPHFNRMISKPLTSTDSSRSPRYAWRSNPERLLHTFVSLPINPARSRYEAKSPSANSSARDVLATATVGCQKFHLSQPRAANIRMELTTGPTHQTFRVINRSIEYLFFPHECRQSRPYTMIHGTPASFITHCQAGIFIAKLIAG